MLAAPTFNDEIINSTQLRSKLPQWLSKAREHPVTIMYKNAPLTIVNRRFIKELSERAHYTNLAVNYCQNYIERTVGRSALPWASYLPDSAKREFFLEFLSVFQEAFAKDNWTIFEDLLHDWKATAEVASSPRLSKALLAKPDESKYVKLES